MPDSTLGPKQYEYLYDSKDTVSRSGSIRDPSQSCKVKGPRRFIPRISTRYQRVPTTCRRSIRDNAALGQMSASSEVWQKAANQTFGSMLNELTRRTVTTTRDAHDR